MSKIAISGAATGTATFTIESPATSTNRTITLADATGTMVVSGTTPSLNGIAFPATQVASADANTLDDYEEGTWTPAFTVSGATFTYGTQYGSYVKVGSFVYAQFYLRVTAYSGTNGNVTITGFPFNTANLNSSAHHSACLWSTTSPAANPVLNNNGAVADLWKQGSITIFTASELINAFFVGGFVYRAA